MKRLILGITVLSLLLAMGIAVSVLFHIAHRPSSHALSQAAQAAQAEDWATAHASFASAQTRWHRYHPFSAAFADHAPMDEIDSTFAQLAVYAQQEDSRQFAALCARLAELVEAMADSHRLAWWTLL